MYCMSQLKKMPASAHWMQGKLLEEQHLRGNTGAEPAVV